MCYYLVIVSVLQKWQDKAARVCGLCQDSQAQRACSIRQRLVLRPRRYDTLTYIRYCCKLLEPLCSLCCAAHLSQEGSGSWSTPEGLWRYISDVDTTNSYPHPPPPPQHTHIHTHTHTHTEHMHACKHAHVTHAHTHNTDTHTHYETPTDVQWHVMCLCLLGTFSSLFSVKLLFFSLVVY